MAEMTTVDSGSTVVDAKLFKIIRLYQILRPAARDQDGRTGRKYRKTLMAVVWLMLAVYITQICALYLVMNDFQRLAHQTLVLSVCLVTWFKGRMLIWNADRMWRVLELGRYAFTSSGHRDPSKLIQCHATLSTLVRSFAAFCYCVVAAWLASPFFIHEPFQVIHLDGTVSKHRMSVLNLWMPLSEAEYNSTPYWAVVYGIEVTIGLFNVFVWTMFDCYMITVCFVLEAQFRTVETAYHQIGHLRLWDDSAVPTTDHHYDRLICHIKDNQKIVRKYDEFFDIVQPVVLFQIAMGSMSGILLIFFTSLMYMIGWSLLSIPVLKFFSGFVTMTLQLFFYCYGFTYVESAKSSLNFALYSSNWTEMDLKFKKTILLAMNMNSCHKRIMKVSPKSVINLEMFARVMRMSYTVVSLLLNTSVEQTVDT